MFSIFLRIAAIFLMMTCGVWLRRRQVIDEVFNRQLSRVLVTLFYPALVFSAIIRNLSWNELCAHWMLPVAVFLIQTMGWLVGRGCLPLLRGRPEPTRACFRFVVAVNNYSFLPIMIVASRSFRSSIVRVARIPGTVHAKELRSGRNALPFKPTFFISLSSTNTARAM
jgi:predicted permease